MNPEELRRFLIGLGVIPPTGTQMAEAIDVTQQQPHREPPGQRRPRETDVGPSIHRDPGERVIPGESPAPARTGVGGGPGTEMSVVDQIRSLEEAVNSGRFGPKEEEAALDELTRLRIMSLVSQLRRARNRRAGANVEHLRALLAGVREQGGVR